MKKYGKFEEVRVKDVKPEGWIKEFLICEGDGMPGHLHEIGYPFDKECWKHKTLTEGGYAQWWPYEQTGYYIDSLVKTAAFTDNKDLLNVVLPQIEKSLEGDDPFIGPVELKEAKPRTRWPHTVYFRALYALWSATGDEKYLHKMRDHYLADTPEHFKTNRDYANIETILKLAEYFEDERLFELAEKAFELYNNEPSVVNVETALSDTPPYGHMVTYNEDGKIPAIMYMYTGNKKYLDASVNAYKKIEQYHMLPDGMHSCSEGPCGSEAWRTHESCDLSDYTWSLGYLLQATGKAEYADKIERVCFNALPGATGHHFKTIQYLSCVNQVISARNSTHIDSWHNTPRMAYQPHHYPECCVSNIGRAMPNYVLRMYQENEKGVVASLYGDSTYNGDAMKITQTGGYPFSSETNFKVEVKDSNKNSLMLRIPSWTKGYTLTVNGEEKYLDEVNGYVTLELMENAEISLKFNMGLSMTATSDSGFYYNYGPFLMTLKIEEEEHIDEKEPRQTKDFPAYNIYPKSEWRYAVKRLEGSEVPEIKFNEVGKNPFWDGYPFEIKVKARELKNWDFVEIKNENDVDNVKGEGIDRKQVNCGASEVTDDLVLTPKLPDFTFVMKNLGEEKEITLVPYGCTKLRLTVFPKYVQDMINDFKFLGE